MTLRGAAGAAEAVGNELQVLLERLRAVCHFEELTEHGHDVVLEVLVVRNGENAVAIGHVARMRHLSKVFAEPVALVC